MRKTSTLCTASKSPGPCVSCRHANQGTVDFREGIVVCRWDQRLRARGATCDVKRELSARIGGPTRVYYLFERYDEKNGTWGVMEDSRLLAEDADAAMRQAMRANSPIDRD